MGHILYKAHYAQYKDLINLTIGFSLNMSTEFKFKNHPKQEASEASSKSKVTLTAVKPKQRYGVLKLYKDKVKYFDNNNETSDVLINAGFFVIHKKAIKKIKHAKIYWEKEPLSYFLFKKKLYAFKHNGFWKSLDTLKDKNDFNTLLKTKKKLPWKI